MLHISQHTVNTPFGTKVKAMELSKRPTNEPHSRFERKMRPTESSLVINHRSLNAFNLFGRRIWGLLQSLLSNLLVLVGIHFLFRLLARSVIWYRLFELLT